MTEEFVKFPKIPRLNRPFSITEKIDGTNAQIVVEDDGAVSAGSRNRWITPGKTTDNHGFAAWVFEHLDYLRETLGVGTHYGEWYGAGIARNYGLDHKRFALFNTDRWKGLSEWDEAQQRGLGVVPVLARPANLEELSQSVFDVCGELRRHGSVVVPGFTNPEGIVVFSYAGRSLWKVTLENDALSKGEAENLGLAGGTV